jgi:hypothetical protein
MVKKPMTAKELRDNPNIISTPKNRDYGPSYCDKCGGQIVRSWAGAMQAGVLNRCECGTKKEPEQIKAWEHNMKVHEEAAKDIREALTFPKGSKIGRLDLLKVLRGIRALPEGHMFPMIAMEHSYKYTHEDFMDIIHRLMKLGELFHPEMGPKARDEDWIQAV